MTKTKRKLGEWVMKKYESSYGEWEDGKEINFDNLSKNQIKWCSNEQKIAIEAEYKYGVDREKVKLVDQGFEWGNERYFDIIAEEVN